MSPPSARGTETDETYERLHQAILRGDFQAISTNPDELRRNPLTEVWKVVST